VPQVNKVAHHTRRFWIAVMQSMTVAEKKIISLAPTMTGTRALKKPRLTFQAKRGSKQNAGFIVT